MISLGLVSGCAPKISDQTINKLREAHAHVQFQEVKPAARPIKPSLHFQEKNIDGVQYIILPWNEGWQLKKYLDNTELNMQGNEDRIELLNKQVQNLQRLF